MKAQIYCFGNIAIRLNIESEREDIVANILRIRQIPYELFRSIPPAEITMFWFDPNHRTDINNLQDALNEKGIESQVTKYEL